MRIYQADEDVQNINNIFQIYIYLQHTKPRFLRDLLNRLLHIAENLNSDELNSTTSVIFTKVLLGILQTSILVSYSLWMLNYAQQPLFHKIDQAVEKMTQIVKEFIHKQNTFRQLLPIGLSEAALKENPLYNQIIFATYILRMLRTYRLQEQQALLLLKELLGFLEKIIRNMVAHTIGSQTYFLFADGISVVAVTFYEINTLLRMDNSEVKTSADLKRIGKLIETLKWQKRQFESSIMQLNQAQLAARSVGAVTANNKKSRIQKPVSLWEEISRRYGGNSSARSSVNFSF